MAIKYNNTSNYLAYKNIPVRAVLRNGNYIYGGPANGQSMYEVTWNTPAKVYSAFQVELTDSTNPLMETGSIVNNPTKDGGVLIASGSTITWDIQTTTDPGYTDATYTVTSGGVAITSPHVVIGDIAFNFESTVRSYKLTYTPSVGCAYVRVKRVGGVGYKGTDDVQFLEFTDTAQEITIYYGDVLTIQEFYPPSTIGYNPLDVTFDNGSDTITVTGDVVLNVVGSPKEFKILYPAAPVGVGYSISKDSQTFEVDSATGGEISVFFGETYTIRVWGEQYYRCPDCALIVQTSRVRLDFLSKTISSGGESVERAREFVFTITKESDYQLVISETEQCAKYALLLDFDEGTSTSSYLRFYRSPYYYSGENDVSSLSSFSLYASAADTTELPENTRYYSENALASEGYAIENVVITNEKGGLIETGDLIKSNITLATMTSQGIVATIVYPALPDGVTKLDIVRTDSKYSRSVSRTYSCDAGGGSFDQFNGEIYCYIGDVLELNAECPDFYLYPTIGVADDLVTGLTNSIDINELTETLIIQGGTRAVTVTFTNTADDVAGWWEFEVESNYPNSTIGITTEGGKGWLPIGSYTLCVGDKITQRGNVIKLMGSRNTPEFYMRHSADIKYRSPACAILKDGEVALASTRDANFSYEIPSAGIYVIQYSQGPLKTQEWESSQSWRSAAGTSLRYGEFDSEPSNNSQGDTLIAEDHLIVDGVFEMPNITHVALWYKAKRYLGDGVTGSFPRHDLTLENGDTFDEDWRRTGGLLPPDSADSVLVGDISWEYKNGYVNLEIGDEGKTYRKATYLKSTLSISEYDINYVGNISSTCVHWTHCGVI